jgi:YVTN family beta-propeller protein
MMCHACIQVGSAISAPMNRPCAPSMFSRSLFGLLLSVATVAAANGASTEVAAQDGVILASAKGTHTLSIVDAKSLAIVASLPIGPDPHEVVVSDDGLTAYVSDMGNITYHQIDVLDLKNRKALPLIDTGPLTGPHGLAFFEGKIWFTAQGAKVVARIDAKSRQVDWVKGTGQYWTHMLVLSHDHKTIFATNIGSGTLSVFHYESVPPLTTALGYVRAGREPVMDWVHTVLPAAVGLEGIDISPDGDEVWATTPVTGQIFVVSVVTRQIKRIIDSKFIGASRLKFTKDGTRVLVTNLRTGELAILDGKNGAQRKRIHVGTGCSGLLIAPDDRRAFVACAFDNYVGVIDLQSYQVTHHIDVGSEPDGLAWAPQ